MMYSDRTLSRKLERTEARSCADMVVTRARLQPESGAEWIEVAGTYAMFDGVESPLTQTFGLGVFEDATAEHLDVLEKFFIDRGGPVFHEVSPMADLSILELLTSRGYEPIELTSVMFRELGVPPSGGENRGEERRVKAGLETRFIKESEADMWASTVAAGWATEQPGLVDFLLAFGKIAARTSGGRPMIAELDGKPVAAAGFQIYDDVCILAGASTIPEARRQGVQNALLAARLTHGAEHGCRLAMICTQPGSQSQTNAQKNGFNIAYTRTKWHLPL